MQYDLILFDCDGTLVDSHGLIVRCFEQSFQHCGLPAPAPDLLKSVIGLSLPRAFERLLATDQHGHVTRLVAGYRDQFSVLIKSDLQREQRLFDGIRPLLDLVRDGGIDMGIVTGKGRPGLESVLDHHGLLGYFSTLQTADRHPSKPHPSMVLEAMLERAVEPEHTLVIGDSLYDIEMASAAGVNSIGVDWGSHDRATLMSAGASAVVGSADELAKTIGL